MCQSDFLINNLICPTLLRTSKGQLGGFCWRSLTIISRCQFDQKIMRVCISYTHLYSIKSLNHTLPSRKCKLCFWANMQVTSTLWPDIKSQKLLHYSNAPHHRRFVMSITNSSGGVGFMSLVMRGAITAGSRTGGDGRGYHRRFL